MLPAASAPQSPPFGPTADRIASLKFVLLQRERRNRLPNATPSDPNCPDREFERGDEGANQMPKIKRGMRANDDIVFETG